MNSSSHLALIVSDCITALLFFNFLSCIAMPTIGGPRSSPYKEMVAVRSEKTEYTLRSSADSHPLKRKLRSDTAATQDCSISTPMKLRSPRKSSNSTDTTPERLASDALKKNPENARKPPVKKLVDHLDVKSSWNLIEQASMVKEALHVSKAPSTVLCRETEQRKVFEYVKSCIMEQKAGSLYICGCPGTGKSLSMERVKQQIVDWTKGENMQAPDILMLNCTSLVSTSEIFTKILGKQNTKKKLNASTSPLQHIQSSYRKPHPSGSKMTLIIADELDYLITKDQSVLHELFMLTTLKFSRCILLGIANAIDLADRFLPRLKSLNCKPAIINFPAYSKDQILRILKERLAAFPYVVFQPKALELCARKVAAASGDMRKALCVCRSALELLEAELRESTSDSDAAPEGDRLCGDAAATHIDSIVKVDHIAATLAKTFKSPTVDIIQSLPQHQQIILCSAVRSFRGCRKDASMGELNKTYVDMCKSVMIPAVGTLEFTSMCRVLNDQGLLKLGSAREDRLKRVSLKVDESDITFALQGLRFFRNCLQSS